MLLKEGSVGLNKSCELHFKRGHYNCLVDIVYT